MSKEYDLKEKSSTPTVEIKIEKLDKKQRNLFAKIQIPYSLEQIWQILTDYEAFTEFMPNLTQSTLLDSPHGGIRLEQVHTRSFMGKKSSSRQVLDVEEKFPSEIYCQQIEGNFNDFSSYWRLNSSNLPDGKDGIDLLYEVMLPAGLPIMVIEKVIRRDISERMLAIYHRAEKLFGSR